jgi:hypothetical protein
VLETEVQRGVPLLNVETEVNWDSQSTNERGPSLFGSLGLSCRYKRNRLLSRLGYSSRPSTRYFFPQLDNFSPVPSKVGRQSCWVVWVLVCVSGLRP